MRKCIVVKLKLFEDLFFENVFVVQRTVLVFKNSGIRALVLDCPDPYRVPVENSETPCWLAQVQTSAGRERGALVADCPGPNKVPITNSGPACGIAQIPTKCRSRTRGLLVKLLRPVQNAGR